MINWRERLPLLTGLVLSIMAHLWLLVPGLFGAMTRQPGDRLNQAALLDPDLITKPDLIPTEKNWPISLGMENSTASTLTWIGYDEYQEQLAALAETEQAQMRTEESAGAPTPGLPSEAAPAVERERPGSAPTIVEAPSQPQPPPVEIVKAEPAPAPAPAAPVGLKALLESLGILPPSEEGVVPPAPADSPQAVPTAADPQPTPSLPSEAAAAAERERPGSAPTVRQPPPQPQPGAPSAPGSGANPDGGPVSDRQSDATSTIDVPPESWKLGKPLAGRGLEILTRKPEFTLLTLMTAAPRNPLFEIRFRRDGKPSLVQTLEGSGDQRVDDALLAALYRWRARGQPLDKLPEGKTIDIRMRIILIARPR